MKADRIKAKAMAYENAAAFIENHGEEGGIDEDTFDFPVEYYLKEAKKIAARLQKQAHKIRLTINTKH